MKFNTIKSMLCVTTAVAMCQASLAHAQQQAAADVEEIVVTGTLIRGIAPVGSNVVGISREEIESSGVIDSNALLGQMLPQSNFFLANPQPGEGVAAGVGRVPLNRPNLRDLPNTNTGSGQPTLVLMDGHRLVPAGIDLGLVVDVGVIPTGITERVETILDGASAVYGSDAVGGVINYITRKRSDDTRLNATYGFANGYWSTSADVASGKAWDGGGLSLSYNFSKSSHLRNRDRDYTVSRNYLEGGRLTGLICDDHGHLTIGAGAALRRFTTPALVERNDYCISNGHSSQVPEQNRQGGSLTFSQDVTDTIKFDLSAFYGYRKTVQDFGPFTGTLPVTARNPYYMTIPGVPNASQTTQTVSFSYGSVLGFEDSQIAETTYNVGQVNSTLTVDVGSWQVRGMFGYGRSTVAVDFLSLNTTLQGNYITGPTGSTAAFPIASAINPYNPAATTNRALIGDLLWHNKRDGITDFYEASVIADGSLFSIPGGEVKTAFGGQWSKTALKRRTTDTTTHLALPYASASSSNKSLFGEVNVPIVGPSNARPGIERLTLSASARWDSYVQYGNTFNPKIGLVYEPVNWFTLRGTWGKSFRAPNALDKLGEAGNRLTCTGQNVPGCGSAGFQFPPGFTAPTGTNNIFFGLFGTSPGVKPEKSNNWTVGFDVRPPMLEGLTISPSYYKINFTDYLSSPTTGNLAPLFNNAPQLILLCINPDGTYRNGGTGCTAAEMATFTSRAPGGADNVQTALAAGNRIMYFADTTVTNLGGAKISGIDLSVRYRRPTSWGAIDASVNTTWKLKNDFQIFAGGPVSNELATGTSRFRMTAMLGVTYGDFRAQATLQHQAGYTPAPSNNRCVCQTTIDQFDVLNMSFRYNVNGTSALTQNLALSMTVNNILDTDPPVSYTTTGGTANGSTLGRLVQFAVSKRF